MGFPYRRHRRCAALTGILAAGVVAGWLARFSGHPAVVPTGPPDSTAAGLSPVASTMDAGILLAPAQRDALAELLLAQDGFAHDLVFLLTASLRDRCVPAHAHELARMAVAARLPVLEGTTLALQRRPDLRGVVYALIRRLAATAPCDRPLDLALGTYRARFDPERYAAAFPNSYFVPDLDAPPMDIADRDLRDRSADPCTPVIYAVMPLDADRAWQCQGLRAMLRRRLVQTCMRGAREVSIADAWTTRLAASIHGDLQKLPAMCQ